MKTERKIIFSADAPAPIGPYSQAVLVGNILYASGQIALDPKTSELVISDIEAETEQVMKNMAAVLKAANMGFENIVKCTIFIKNMDDFARINAVYQKYFPTNPPARETVEVVCLPKNVNVEISFISYD